MTEIVIQFSFLVFSTPIKFQRIKLKRESYYMKRIILTIGICIAFFEIGYGQILTFENSGLGGNEASTTSNSNDTNIASSTLSRGSGVNASNNGGRFNATSHSTESTLVTGDNSYFTFNINPNSGFSFSVTDIEFNFQRSGTGPKSFALRSSNDSFASNLGSEVTISDVTSTQTLTFTFSLSNITSNTEFRLYTYNAESTSGSGGIGDGSGNDIVVNGSTTSTGGVVSKLVVTQINSGNSPSVGTAFDVVVQTQDASDTPSNVSSDVNVTLTKATGTGTLGGTLTGTISSGSNSVTISGVTFDTNGSGISMTASDDASSLTSGTSSTFNVLTAADQLVLVSVPTTGYTNNALSDFTVEARRSNDSSVDANYTNSITINKATGSGNIGGTTSSSASSGVATFSNVTFDASGGYTIEATDGSLTSSASSTITISTINTSPSIGDLFITEYADGAGSGNYIYEFLEIYNPTNEGVDVNGYTLRQRNSTQSLTFSSSTVIPSNGFLVVGRNSDESSFETFWSVTFSDKVTYVNGNNSFISLNGGEDYLIENGSGTNIDPATDDEYTAQTVSSSGRVARINFSGNATSDYITGASSEATPGSLDAAVEITGDAGWRLLSLPITNGDVSDVSDDSPVQGIVGGSDASRDANFYVYDDSGAWEEPTNATTAWGDGYGFAMYFYNNTTNGSSALPVTLDSDGLEPISDVSVNLYGGAANRFTLVGNPFASNLNTNSITVTGGSIQNNISFWNDAGSTYSAQDRTGPYIIAPWQGFFVETSDASASSITIPTTAKTTSATSGTFFSKVANIRGDINFALTSETTNDEAIRLSFRANATPDWDLDDASKLTPLLPAYATLGFATNNMVKSVESLPYRLEEEVTLPMQLDLVGVEGEFSLGWDGLETIPDDWELVLHDYEQGTSVNLRNIDEYTFEAEPEVASKRNPLTLLSMPAKSMAKASQDERFGLTVRPVSVGNEEELNPYSFTLDQNYPNPFNPSTTIRYTIAKEGMVKLIVFNTVGQQIAKLVNTTQVPGDYNVRWSTSNVPSGIYFYRLEAADGSMTRRMTVIK